MPKNADIVNGWFASMLASGPLSRNTDAYNQVTGALPALIAALDGGAEPVATDGAQTDLVADDTTAPAKSRAKPAAAPDATATA